MAIRRLTLPSVPEIIRDRTDNFTIGELSDFYDMAKKAEIYAKRSHTGIQWSGGLPFEDALKAIDTGHLPSVALSDQFLKDVENILPAPTARHKVIDDVTGAVPNVPAYLAGVPLNMRRKTKQENEFAPITIFVDLSGGAVIELSDVARRGAAVLALVRAMSTRRPVELYAGASLNARGNNSHSFFYRIETAPLDLARAAYILSHPSAYRMALMTVAKCNAGFDGQWIYGVADPETIKPKMHLSLRRAFPEVSDYIYVPGATPFDPAIRNPVQWVKDMVRDHLGEIE